MGTRLAIIIVNYRTPGLTVDCLRSLAPEVAANPGTRVVVVENGSGDDSGAKIKDAIDGNRWSAWCTLIVTEKNWGFAGGNNRGQERVMQEGGADYVLLLNSDTLVQPGCLKQTVELMEADRGIGLLSCRLLNKDGSAQNVCRKFPSPLRCVIGAFSLPWKMPRLFGWADCEDLTWDRNTVARDVDWLGGAFMLIRGEWLAKHKGLDERFFFYGEDIEICHRVWRTGYRCHYDPTSTVVHLGGSSSDPTRMAAGTRSVHSWRGRYLVQRFCYGRTADWLLRWVDLINVRLRLMFNRGKGPKEQELSEALGMLRDNWSKWNERRA